MDKYCWRCKRVLPEECFEFRADKSKGRLAACRECQDPNGIKRCRTCDQLKPKSEYHRSSKGPKGSPLKYLQADCKTCQASVMRAYHLRAKYGMTWVDYHFYLEKQNHCCAVCGRRNNEPDLLRVDHDHACCPGEKTCGKCVRGLLCDKCNRGLGLLGDSALNLRAALSYIERVSL